MHESELPPASQEVGTFAWAGYDGIAVDGEEVARVLDA